MRLIFFIGILAVLGGHSITEGANFVTAGKDLLGSTLNIGKGVAKAIPSYLDPAQILDLGKQSILGYPVNLLAEAINSVCSVVQSTGYLRSGEKPEGSNLAFRLFTPCKNYSYPIESADDMWTNPDFDKNKPVVLFATGWTTNINETDAMTILAKAHACRGDNNFIGVDAADYVQTLYTWAALNTVQIGTYVGKGLSLLKGKVPSENIHLIGHSLGAHIVSQAGRTYYNLTGEYIGRITGLDPALPCFNEGEELTGLSRGDALYVDIIHSNPGNLGKKDPIGDIDFYPGGLDPLISGCFDIACSHERSWKLYAESVYPGNENVFMSAKCNSQNAVVRGDCGDLNVPMGYPDKPFNTKGNFFLTVNGKSPYGKGQGKPIDPSCGTCPSKR